MGMHYDKCGPSPHAFFQGHNNRGAAAVASKNHDTLIEGRCRMTLRCILQGGSSSHLRPCLGLRKASDRFGNEDFFSGFFPALTGAWTCEVYTKMAQNSLDCAQNVPLGMDMKRKKLSILHIYCPPGSGLLWMISRRRP